MMVAVRKRGGVCCGSPRHFDIVTFDRLDTVENVTNRPKPKSLVGGTTCRAWGRGHAWRGGRLYPLRLLCLGACAASNVSASRRGWTSLIAFACFAPAHLPSTCFVLSQESHLEVQLLHSVLWPARLVDGLALVTHGVPGLVLVVK